MVLARGPTQPLWSSSLVEHKGARHLTEGYIPVGPPPSLSFPSSSSFSIPAWYWLPDCCDDSRWDTLGAVHDSRRFRPALETRKSLKDVKRVLCVVNDDKKGVPSSSGVVHQLGTNLKQHLLEHFAGPKRPSGWRTAVAFSSFIFTTSQYLWSIHRPTSRPSIDVHLVIKSWADGPIWPSRPTWRPV